MLELRPFDRLGVFSSDWLNAHYHFSFADYHDPARMNLGALRVWNDDTIQPGTGFPMHGHRDMEIVTYIRQGAISHEDSLGNMGRTEAGQVQVMSAGSGILHAEANLEPGITTLFQIWIQPNQRGLPPRWETKPFPRSHGKLEVMASGWPEDGAIHLHQDARVLAATLDQGDRLDHSLNGRKAYLVAAKGDIVVNGITVTERSGLVAADEPALTIEAARDAEIVMVELA